MHSSGTSIEQGRYAENIVKGYYMAKRRGTVSLIVHTQMTSEGGSLN